MREETCFGAFAAVSDQRPETEDVSGALFVHFPSNSPCGVNGACDALNWMHCEESRPASEDKNQHLRADVEQRVILAAMRWVDAESAVDEHEALASTFYALGVSSNVGSYEYSRVSFLDSVVDAPPLIVMLRAEAKFFLEEVESSARWCPSDDEDWAYCPHPSTRLRGRRLLREKQGESTSAHR